MSDIVTIIARSFSLSELTKIIGEDFASSLPEDTRMTNRTLAEMYINQMGKEIFSEKKIRDKVCKTYGIPLIRSWKEDSRCEEFLEILGLEKDYFPQEEIKVNAIETLDGEYGLYNYQEYIKKKISNFLVKKDEKQKLMVQLPTGSGKTRIAMQAIFDFFRFTQEPHPIVIWMAHTDELCEQAIKTFKEDWRRKGTGKIKVLRAWKGLLNEVEDIPNGPVFVVISFQSAWSHIKTKKDKIDEFRLKIAKRSKVLFVDEAHLSLAKTYREVIEKYRGSEFSCKIVGLTATPGRHGIDQDNEQTLKLAKFYDNNHEDISPFCDGKTPLKYLQERGILAEVKRSELKTGFDLELTAKEIKIIKEEFRIPDSVGKRIGNNNERNQLIVGQIFRLVRKNKKKILVFASSVNNSNLLFRLLKQRDINAQSVTKDTSRTQRARAVTDFANGDIDVLINYGIFTTGFDDPKIDCVVIARPTVSVVLYSQMVGRGMRGIDVGGTSDCELIDIVDNIENQPDIEQASTFFAEEWAEGEILRGD